MTKKQIIQLIQKLMPVVFIICMVAFVRWPIVSVWITPLPDSIKEKLNETNADYKFDGMIVYVNQSGKPPAFYSADWEDRRNKIPLTPHSLFKITGLSDLYAAYAAAEDAGKFLRTLNGGSLLDERELEINSSIYKNKHSGLIPSYWSAARYNIEIDASTFNL